MEIRKIEIQKINDFDALQIKVTYSFKVNNFISIQKTKEGKQRKIFISKLKSS